MRRPPATLAHLHATTSVVTSVHASPIVLCDSAEPGRSYDLPWLYIMNTGTEASHYAVIVKRLTQGVPRDVPAGRIGGGREDLPLAPGQSTTIPLTRTVPGDAAPGEYLTNLVAGTTAPSVNSGVAVGAAATAEVRL